MQGTQRAGATHRANRAVIGLVRHEGDTGRVMHTPPSSRQVRWRAQGMQGTQGTQELVSHKGA